PGTVTAAIVSPGGRGQKYSCLPKIAAGELVFSIGSTEPEAGTDLASLRTAAVREGDEFVINGSKIFTSGGPGADWIWLAARTNQEAPKHKGISLILVPTTAAGFSVTPIEALGHVETSATY